jgi:Flp pilus assembly protein TadD
MSARRLRHSISARLGVVRALPSPRAVTHRHRRSTRHNKEGAMRWTLTLTERLKQLTANVVVGTILLGAIVLAGCDVPESWRKDAGAAEGDAAAVAAASVGGGAPTVVPASTAPTPVVSRIVTYGEAEAAFRAGSYAEAAELFTAYVETKPENPWGHYMLGLSAWKNGDHPRAEEAFGRASALDPRHVKSYLNLARVLLETARPADALARVDTALTLDSLSNVAFRLRGRALGALGRYEEAVEAYRHAITMDDHDVWSMNNLGLLYLEEGWPEEALYPLARAVELDSTMVVFLNNLGMALEHSGRYGLAADVYRRAIGVDSTSVKATANLARVDGRPDDALVVPVDLAQVAREFAGWVEGWRASEVTVARRGEPPLP